MLLMFCFLLSFCLFCVFVFVSLLFLFFCLFCFILGGGSFFLFVLGLLLLWGGGLFLWDGGGRGGGVVPQNDSNLYEDSWSC